MEFLDFSGGINWRLPAYRLPKNQCVYLQNFRHENGFMESIPGMRRYHTASLGSDPVTAIMPYYGEDTALYVNLVASGDSIYKRDESANTYASIKSGLVPNSIFTHAIRRGVMYIASLGDDLMKYLGGNQIETVGGGLTKPGKFRKIVYMREIDRLFGLGDTTIKGQISWCDISAPEIWDAANVDRMKLEDGEDVQGGEILYGKLIILNDYSIWIYYVYGTEDNWKLEKAPTRLGCRAPNTIKVVGNEIWFLGESPREGIGIYAFNGSTSRILTDDITPLFERINSEKIDQCAAEYHNGIYKLSFPLDFQTSNSHTVELDSLNLKEDGTPAIYGPHTYFFHSSAVLNTINKNGELLMGDYSDGFIYYENGTTLKSTNGNDGTLMQLRFLSGIHNDDKIDIMKRYENLRIFFIPRGYFETKLRVYFSYGESTKTQYPFFPDANMTSIMGDFNVYDERILGTPDLSQYLARLGANARGTSIQIEIVSDAVGNRLALQGFKYDPVDLYQTRRVQSYAF